MRRRTDNPFVDPRHAAGGRRGAGLLWLVAAAVVVAVSTASPRVSQWWLAGRLAEDVAAIDPSQMAERFEALAELGEPGIAVLVGLLDDERPAVAPQAARALDLAQATWQTKSRSEAERYHHCLVQQLRLTAPRLSDEMSEPCLTLLSRVLEQCVTAETTDGQSAFREATALVAVFQPTAIPSASNAYVPRLALSRSPGVPLVPLESGTAAVATAVDASVENHQPTGSRPTGSSVLRVSVASSARSSSPDSGPAHRPGPTEDAADEQSSVQSRDAAVRADRTTAEPTPMLRLHPPGERADRVDPENALRSTSPAPTDAGLSGGGSLQPASSLVATGEPSPDAAPLRRAAVSPERLVRVHADVTSLDVAGDPLGLPRTLEPYTDREIVDLAGSVQPHLTQLASDELRRRGFSEAELQIARGIASPRYAERLALARTLPTRSDVDPRRWLQWLAEDPEREIRHEAISAIATMDDPQMVQWLAQRLSREADPTIARTIRESLNR